jgi:hypothetical protein
MCGKPHLIFLVLAIYGLALALACIFSYLWTSSSLRYKLFTVYPALNLILALALFRYELLKGI